MEKKKDVSNIGVENGISDDVPERKPNTRHAKMSVAQRAKQFMPFSALTGLEAAISEKERELEMMTEESD